ncbi:MAG: hypothetical protein ABSA26_11845 [Thermoguttaceae bacterium]|jgi:hypothetical protein
MIYRINIYFTAGLVLFACIFACGRFDFAKALAADKIVTPQQRPIDEAKASAAGIHKLSGKRLTLHTDVSGEEIDRLPEVFDQAFLQYCDYFHIPSDELADWRMTGFLMKDKSRFVQTGLLPGDLPDFPHGFSLNYELWIYDQSSDYYRRHLLLHEGVHGFMNTVLGGCGPTWYMEGMAEMLATHELKNGRLELNYFPKNRKETPDWGRIKLIKDAVTGNRALSLRTVIDGPRNLQKETELYAWSWAAAAFLDRHPRYRDRFRELYKHVRQADFNQYVFEVFKNDWPQLNEEWQVFIAGLEYGYDIPRTTIDFAPGKPLPEKGGVVAVAADRGWQNSGVALLSGVKYQLKASGRYQVANQPKIWWCEPGGVSIRYYQGRPLGVLLAAVRPENPSMRSQAEPGNEKSLSAFLQPITVGLGTTIVPEQSGTLFLKINDSAAELDDNAGELKVEIGKGN